MKTPKILIPALRQYQHSDCSGPLSGFDYDETVKIVTNMEQAVVEAVEGLMDIEGEKHGYITDKIRNEHFTEAISAIRKVFNPTGEKE